MVRARVSIRILVRGNMGVWIRDRVGVWVIRVRVGVG